jgi:TonB family protein
LLRDLESILYSYTPAPGSADVAIYLNRLHEAERAAAASGSGAATRPSREPQVVTARPAAAPTEVPKPPPTEMGPPSGSAPPEEAPTKPAEVFGSFSAAAVESERKGRLPLYAAIAAVVVLGGIVALILGRRGAPEPAAVSPTPAPVATAAPLVAEAPPAPIGTPVAVSAASIESAAIQQEVQRQLAQKRQELQKPPAPSVRPTALPLKPTKLPAIAELTEAPIVQAEPTSPPPPPTVPPPEPTEVAVAAPPPAEAVPAAARQASPAEEEEVTRGDLVGPGPGVIEPALVAPPRVNYSPLARQQRVSGRVIVLVLVTENGTVSDARIQKGIGGRSRIDEAVLDAVRVSRFRAATKNGIPVKMWRTVVVDVKS